MPIATSAVTHRRADLTMHVREAVLNQSWLWPLLLPQQDVALRTDNFKKVPAASVLAAHNLTYSAKAGTPRDDWELDEDSYSCAEFQFDVPLSDLDKAKYESQGTTFDAEAFSAERAMGIGQLRLEKACADLLFNAATFAGFTGAVGTAWQTSASCTPITDIIDASTTMNNRLGVWPDTLVLTVKSWKDVSNAAQVLDRIKFVNTGVTNGMIDVSELRSVFKIPRILIANNIYNSAADGLTTVGTQNWANGNALLCVTRPTKINEEGVRVAEDTNTGTMQLGRTFAWTGYGGTGEMFAIRNDVRDETLYRIRQSVHQKLFGARFGHLLTGV